MQGSSKDLILKYENASILVEQPQSRVSSFKDFLEDQCNHFFKDFNLPSKSFIIDAEKEEKFGNLKTYDEGKDDREDNQEICLEENINIQIQENLEQICWQKDGKRTRKTQKSSQYSKNYRLKKKQKLKGLEEQNRFLKNKIDELQNRLREKQLELNRIKYSNNQEDYSIQQLNTEIIKKLNLITDSQNSNIQIKQEEKTEYQKRDKQIEEFLKFFSMHGLGGKRTCEVIEYHVNQFLQNVMRDREKYYFLICIKKKYLNPVKTPLDIALDQAIPRSYDQKKEGARYFDRMRPLFEQLLSKCRDFFKSSRQVIKVLQKIHETTKKEFMANIDEAKKRLKTALWFHVNQYRKEMRNIRAQWIDLVKNPEESEEQSRLITKKKTKVKD